MCRSPLPRRRRVTRTGFWGAPLIFLGEDEINAGVVACKDMKSGEQTKLNTQETIDRIKAGLAELEKGSVIVE